MEDIEKVQQSSLTLEQQFRMKILTEQVMQLNLEQAQSYLIELLTQSMVKDNLFKQLIRQ